MIDHDPSRGIRTVHPGHPQVHQDHVRREGLHAGHCLRPVGGLADDLQVGLHGEQGHQA
jgi:hypothetical protein